MITNIPLNIKNPYTQDSYCFDLPLFPITLLTGQYKTSIINEIHHQENNSIMFDNSILNSNRPKEIKRLIECLHINDILLIDDIDLFYDIYNNAIDIFENVPDNVQIICSAHTYGFIYYFLGKILDLQHYNDILKPSDAGQIYGITRIRQYNNGIHTDIITNISYNIERYAEGLQYESYLKGDCDK